MESDPQKKIAQRLFKAKLKRREHIARLPIEKKILLLIRLQKIAAAFPSRPGKIERGVWYE
jgi:hypothetical protein